MITRILQTKIWKDDFVSSLKPAEKLLFVYFLTNPKVNIICCYEISDREVIFDTGVSQKQLNEFKEKVNDRILFNGNYVFLLNARKYEQYLGKKNYYAKLKLYSQLPDSIYDWCKGILDRGMYRDKDMSIDKGSIGTINHKSEIINHKSDTPTEMPNRDRIMHELTKIKDELRKKGSK